MTTDIGVATATIANVHGLTTETDHRCSVSKIMSLNSRTSSRKQDAVSKTAKAQLRSEAYFFFTQPTKNKQTVDRLVFQPWRVVIFIRCTVLGGCVHIAFLWPLSLEMEISLFS